MRIESRAWPCDCGCQDYQEPKSESPFYFDSVDPIWEDIQYEQYWEVRRRERKAPTSRSDDPLMDEAPYPYYAGFLAEIDQEDEYWSGDLSDFWYDFTMIFEVFKKFFRLKR